MKRQILIALGLAFLPALASAANFSGSWVKDNAKSDPVPNLMYWLTRAPAGGGRGGGGAAGGRGGGPQIVMTVKQDAGSLQFVTGDGAPTKYMLDGKPMTRTTETGVQKATVSAKMMGDTVVIGTSQPYGGMPGNATLEIKEVWSLSPDGKTLTITTTRDVPAQEKTYKQVYNLK